MSDAGVEDSEGPPADGSSGMLSVPLDELLVFKTVQVIETIDVAALKATLKYILDQVHASSTLDAVREENAELRQLLDELKGQQARMQAEIEMMREPLATIQSQRFMDDLKAESVENRLTALEQGMPGLTKQETTDALQSQLQGFQQDTRDQLSKKADVDETSTLRHEALALTDIVESLGKAHNALRTDVDTLRSDQGTLRTDVDGLKEAMGTKADQTKVDEIQAQVLEKTDRSELDALVKSGFNFNMADMGPLVAEGEKLDLKSVTELARRNALDVAAVRGLAAVLQDRLGNKADAVIVNGLQRSSENLRIDIDTLERDIIPVLPKIDNRLASFESGLSDLRHTVGEVQASMPVVKPGGHQEDPAAVRELRHRVEALEARPETMIGARAVASAGSLPGSGSAGELLPDGSALTEIYRILSTKVDRSIYDALDRKVHNLSDSLSSKVDSDVMADLNALVDRKANTSDLDMLERKLRSLQRTLELAGGGAGAPGSGMLGAAMAIEGLESSIKKVQMGLANKADLLALDNLAGRISRKADVEVVEALRQGLTGCATKPAMEELALKVAMMSAVNPPGAGAEGGGTGLTDDNSTALLSAVQALVLDKASRQELDGFRDMVSQRPFREELEHLVIQMAEKAPITILNELFESKANQDSVTALTQHMATLAADVGTLMEKTAGGTRFGNSNDDSRGPPALARDMESLRERLELLAHAANIMAAGRESDPGAATTTSSSSGYPPPGSTTSTSKRSPSPPQNRGALAQLALDPTPEDAPSPDGGGGAEAGPQSSPQLALPLGRGGDGEGGGREPNTAQGAYERLVARLYTGDAVCHKMNAFDPEILHRMAQKLSMLEAAVRNPAYAARLAQASAPDVGLRDLESKVKRMVAELKTLREQVLVGVTTGTLDPGDHAILASKPVGGYRCMACDRPLDKLDDAPGKYVANRKLPVMVPAAVEVASKHTVVQPRLSPGGPGLKKTHAADAAANNGPQNWYADGKGAPALELPKEDVGPTLPKGGWRGNQAQEGVAIKGDAARNTNPVNLPDIGQR